MYKKKKWNKMIKCPTCQTVIIDELSFNPCKHVLACINEVDNQEFSYLSPSIKKQIKTYVRCRSKLNGGSDDLRTDLVRLYQDNDNVSLVQFIGEYLGGDLYENYYIAFGI